jgi:hypothetical protein
LNVAATATPGATSAQVFAAFNLAFSLGSFVGESANPTVLRALCRIFGVR